LSRYTDNIIVGYDADEAGVKASSRAISLLEKSGMNIKVLRMREAKDPDEFLQKFGADAFRLLLGDSENHIAYKLAAISDKTDLSTDDGKLEYIARATELIAKLQSAPEREIYGRQAAGVAGVSYEAVANEITKKRRMLASRQKKQRERGVTRPLEALRSEDKTLRYDQPFSAVAEEGVVRALVNDPTLLETVKSLNFSASEFTSPFLAGIFETIESKCESSSVPTPAALMAVLPPAEAAKLTGILLKP
jgi:DNA primase